MKRLLFMILLAVNLYGQVHLTLPPKQTNLPKSWLDLDGTQRNYFGIGGRNAGLFVWNAADSSYYIVAGADTFKVLGANIHGNGIRLFSRMTSAEALINTNAENLTHETTQRIIQDLIQTYERKVTADTIKSSISLLTQSIYGSVPIAQQDSAITAIKALLNHEVTGGFTQFGKRLTLSEATIRENTSNIVKEVTDRITSINGESLERYNADVNLQSQISLIAGSIHLDSLFLRLSEVQAALELNTDIVSHEKILREEGDAQNRYVFMQGIDTLTAQVNLRAKAISLDSLKHRTSNAETAINMNSTNINNEQMVRYLADSTETYYRQSSVNNLQSQINIKANASRVDTLLGRMSNAESSITLNSQNLLSEETTRNRADSTETANRVSSINTLTSSINLKANATRVDSLNNRMSSAEGTISINTQNIAGEQRTRANGDSTETANRVSAFNNLQSQINIKANTTKVDSLTGRVGNAESAISLNAQNITHEETLRYLADSVETFRRSMLSDTIKADLNLRAKAISLDSLKHRTTNAESAISLNSSNITNEQRQRYVGDSTEVYQRTYYVNTLQSAINLKANATRVDTLSGKMSNAESGISLNAQNIAQEGQTRASAINTLTASLALKASIASKDSLRSRMTTAEAGISANASNIGGLQSSLALKANTNKVDSLKNRLTNAESSINMNAQDINTVSLTSRGRDSVETYNRTTADNILSSSLTLMTKSIYGSTPIKDQDSVITAVKALLNDEVKGGFTAFGKRLTLSESLIDLNSKNIVKEITERNDAVKGEAETRYQADVQLQSSILLKANSANVDSLRNRLTNAESSISLNTYNISHESTLRRKADSTETFLRSTLSDTITAQLNLKAAAISVDSLRNRTASAESAISLNSTNITHEYRLRFIADSTETYQRTYYVNYLQSQINLKANANRIDTLSGRMTSAESGIGLNASNILSESNLRHSQVDSLWASVNIKATVIDVDTAYARISLEASKRRLGDSTMAAALELKVGVSDVYSLLQVLPDSVKISSNNILFSTLNGVTIQTSNGNGKKIVINPTTNAIDFYDANGNNSGSIYGNYGYDSRMLLSGNLNVTGNIEFHANTPFAVGQSLEWQTTGNVPFTHKMLQINSGLQEQISDGATAYGWGNHASAGYATQEWVNNQGFLKEASISWNSITDKPATFTPSTHTHTNSQSNVIDAGNGLQWYTAGNEPFTYKALGVSYAIETGASDGATAYGWGNHASAGYLTTSAFAAWVTAHTQEISYIGSDSQAHTINVIVP